jgi:hypothetical protein
VGVVVGELQALVDEPLPSGKFESLWEPIPLSFLIAYDQ